MASNPVVQALKKALEDLDAIKVEKEKVMNEGVTMHDNLSPLEDLMAVHGKKVDKQSVFSKYQQEYTTFFSKNEEFEKQKQEITGVIQSNSGPFAAVIGQVQADPAKAAFFQQLNEAILIQSQLSNMLEQGNQFYSKLNDILIKLQQSVADYKMGRDIQKNDILSKQGGGQGQPPAGGQPGNAAQQ